MLLKYHEYLTCVIKCFRYSTNLYIITICNDMTQGNRNCSAVRARHFAFVWVCESYMEMLTVSRSSGQPSSSQPQTYRGVCVWRLCGWENVGRVSVLGTATLYRLDGSGFERPGDRSDSCTIRTVCLPVLKRLERGVGHRTTPSSDFKERMEVLNSPTPSLHGMLLDGKFHLQCNRKQNKRYFCILLCIKA